MSRKKTRVKKKRSAVKQPRSIQKRYFSRQANWSKTLQILKHHNNSNVDKESYDKIMMRPYLSFGQLRLGKAIRDDIAVLVQAFSFTQGLLIRFRDFSNLGQEMQSMMVDVKSAEKALHELAQRKEMHGGFVATGQELKAIDRCLGILDGLVEASTLNHVSAALQYSIDEINLRRDRFYREQASQEQKEEVLDAVFE